MTPAETLVDAMRRLDASGLNRGASGNVSLRDGAHMLIPPSGIPPADLRPEMAARIPLAGEPVPEGPLAPSSEWRFHRALLATRAEFGAVVHSHAPWCTVLAVARKPIPAVHYMMAAFGGPEIRCSAYARYGSAELADAVLAAMEGRSGCLLANHGMVTAAADMDRALWLAAEMEALAHQYVHALQIGGPVILDQEALDATLAAFAEYGPKKA